MKKIISLIILIFSLVVACQKENTTFYETATEVNSEREGNFYQYANYEEAYKDFVNAYTEKDFQKAYYISLEIAYDYENIYNLSYEQKLKTLFQLYDTHLQIIFCKRRLEKEDYEKVDNTLFEIYSHVESPRDMGIITNDFYMNQIFQLGLKYHFQVENINKKSF